MHYTQLFDNFRAKKRFQRLANMSYGLGQVFAHERCLSQSWTNFSYASEKGKLCRVLFRENVLYSIIWQFSYGLGQVFAHEICLSQSCTNFSYASEKGKLWRVFFFWKMYYIQLFDNFRAKKRFQRLANMSYGLGQVFAHEICLSQSLSNFSSPEKRGRCLKGKIHLFRFFTISGGKKVFRG